MKVGSNIRVLLVPDKIWGVDSGARSARYTVKSLNDSGYTVGVYAYPITEGEIGVEKESLFDFYPRSTYRTFNQFFANKLKEEFEIVLSDFRPHYVFFVGAAINKLVSFFKSCRVRDIPTILLFYINDYYCSRIYAGLRNGPCFKCLRGNYMPALWNKCQKGKPKWVHFIINAAIRMKLRAEFRKCHAAFAYSNDQISLYRRYGISNKKCFQCPIFFDKETIKGVKSILGDYFILCGQSTMEKGWHIISDVISLCPSTRFMILFQNKAIAASNIETYKLKKFIDNGQIEVVTDVIEHKDLLMLLAASKGVLVPAYYPTTGEFLLMEALGIGKPVIVFNSGIHTEVIRSGENGMLANVGDIERYAAHIRSLDSDDNLCNKISAGARLLFEQLSSPEEFRTAFQKAMATRRLG